MIPDPTTEIKAFRHKLGEEMNFDLDRIIDDVIRQQEESDRLFIRLPKREPRATMRHIESAQPR